MTGKIKIEPHLEHYQPPGPIPSISATYEVRSKQVFIGAMAHGWCSKLDVIMFNHLTPQLWTVVILSGL